MVSANNPFLAPKTALITGASSGIGLELAHLFAQDSYRLVLVARNRGALHELADELQSRYSITIRISPKDLAHPASPAELYQELQEAGIVLDVLVNNAGFGGSGRFADTDWNNEAEMIQVNIAALTHLTKLFLPQIRAREGKLLNVASVVSTLVAMSCASTTMFTFWPAGSATLPLFFTTTEVEPASDLPATTFDGSVQVVPNVPLRST